MCDGALLWRNGPFLLTNACCRHCRFWCISLIFWAHFSDVMVLLHWNSESCSDQTNNRPPQWPWTLMQIWLEKYFGASSRPNHWSGHCRLSYTIHFSSNTTIWSRNGPLLLCRIKKKTILQKDDILILSQLMRHLLNEFFHLSNFLQRQNDHSVVVIGQVVVRGSVCTM